MERDLTFTHIGAEANQLLMKIAKKSHVHNDKYCQKEPLFSPRSNDNKVTVKDELLKAVGAVGSSA